MVRSALLALVFAGGCVVADREEPRMDPRRTVPEDRAEGGYYIPIGYPEFDGARWRSWWFAHKPLLDWRIGPRP